jgi:hypothetical protein
MDDDPAADPGPRSLCLRDRGPTIRGRTLTSTLGSTPMTDTYLQPRQILDRFSRLYPDV